MLSVPTRLKKFNPPICPNCLTKMVFVRAESEKDGFLKRTFKCRACGCAEADFAKVEPVFRSHDIKRPAVTPVNLRPDLRADWSGHRA